MYQFSPETAILGAFITFLVSGVLGALLKEWLDRAKPRILPTAFALRGGDSLLRIPDSLIAMTAKSGWVERFHRYESYAGLKGHTKAIKRIVSRLKLAREAADEWLSRNKSWEQVSAQHATLDEMSQVPFAHDNTISSAMYGGARRSELSAPPVSLEELETMNSVTQLIQAEGRFYLYLTDRYISVPIEEGHADIEKRNLTTIGLSFAKGSKRNIYHYMHEMRRKATEDCASLTEIIEALERFLLPESFLSLTASVVNSGTKPMVVRPYGKLAFHNEELNRSAQLLRVRQPRAAGDDPLLQLLRRKMTRRPNPTSSPDTESDGDEVIIEEVFPSSKDGGYIFVAPKSSLDVELVAATPLGKNSDRILSMYTASVLRCSVELLTTDDVRFSSSKVLFGNSITDHEAKLLRLPIANTAEG